MPRAARRPPAGLTPPIPPPALAPRPPWPAPDVGGDEPGVWDVCGMAYPEGVAKAVLKYHYGQGGLVFWGKQYFAFCTCEGAWRVESTEVVEAVIYSVIRKYRPKDDVKRVVREALWHLRNMVCVAQPLGN